MVFTISLSLAGPNSSQNHKGEVRQTEKRRLPEGGPARRQSMQPPIPHTSQLPERPGSLPGQELSDLVRGAGELQRLSAL